MKKIEPIAKEMKEINLDLVNNSSGLKKGQKTAMKNRYNFLRTCKLYLEAEPTVDFLKSEKARLNNKIKLINEGHIDNEKIDLRDQKKERKEYDKIMGTAKFKIQLKTLNFLLND